MRYSFRLSLLVKCGYCRQQIDVFFFSLIQSTKLWRMIEFKPFTFRINMYGCYFGPVILAMDCSLV